MRFYRVFKSTGVDSQLNYYASSHPSQTSYCQWAKNFRFIAQLSASCSSGFPQTKEGLPRVCRAAGSYKYTYVEFEIWNHLIGTHHTNGVSATYDHSVWISYTKTESQYAHETLI